MQTSPNIFIQVCYWMPGSSILRWTAVAGVLLMTRMLWALEWKEARHKPPPQCSLKRTLYMCIFNLLWPFWFLFPPLTCSLTFFCTWTVSLFCFVLFSFYLIILLSSLWFPVGYISVTMESQPSHFPDLDLKPLHLDSVTSKCAVSHLVTRVWIV